MATEASDGQVLDIHPPNPVQAMPVSSSVLINLNQNVPASTADTSPWVQFQPFSRAAIEISGTATSGISVQFNGSCSDDNPSVSGALGSSLGAAVTAKGISFVTWAGVRWVQAVVADTTSGGYVNVALSAVAP